MRTRTIEEILRNTGCEEAASGGLLDLVLTVLFRVGRKRQKDKEGDYAKGECEKEPHQRWAVLLSGEDDAENAGAEVAK